MDFIEISPFTIVYLGFLGAIVCFLIYHKYFN